MDHIAGADPFEFGSSRPLDFGHWAAHKLEKLSDFRIRHGEAVAIGIALDSAYSFLQGRIGEGDLIRIFKLFHTERTTWNLKFDFKKDMVSNLPEDGEQSIAQSLFESQDNLIKLRELASKNFEFSIDHISPVSFFATGGLTRPLPVSSGLIKIITRIESYIPKKLLRYCASRALIVIRIIK